MQGAAVALAFPLEDGISAVWLPPLLELLLLLLELLLLALDSVHGGTISVVMLLFDGTTSWFWGVCPELACAAEPPPGVTRIVLAGGGDGGGALLLLLLELLLLELDELIGAMHGWIATVSVKEPGGMTISLEPGGTAPLPDCTTCASEQGGTAIFRAVFCLGICTVRIPGSINAVDIASELDELPPLLLLPQPASPRDTTATAPMTHLPTERRITTWSPPLTYRREPAGGNIPDKERIAHVRARNSLLLLRAPAGRGCSVRPSPNARRARFLRQ
ncbi:MAG: hypothetical protein M3Y17_00590 [Actinomycetota bacterium]|nr:hypothetical protein [Actinomycetota bacterium]